MADNPGLSRQVTATVYHPSRFVEKGLQPVGLGTMMTASVR